LEQGISEAHQGETRSNLGKKLHFGISGVQIAPVSMLANSGGLIS
jgi:hypothetical protein